MSNNRTESASPGILLGQIRLSRRARTAPAASAVEDSPVFGVRLRLSRPNVGSPKPRSISFVGRKRLNCVFYRQLTLFTQRFVDAPIRAFLHAEALSPAANGDK